MQNSLKLLAKRSLKTLAAPLAWLRWAGLSGEKVLIFGYHRIAADNKTAEQEAISGLITSTATFARHMEILRESYQVITLDEAVLVLRGLKRLDRPAAVITFDDGYADVYEQAFPVLRRLGLPATVFLPTKYIGTDDLLPHDRLYWLFRQLAHCGLDYRTVMARAGLQGTDFQVLRQSGTPAEQSAAAVNIPAQARAELIDVLEQAVNLAQHPYPRGYRLLDWEQIAEMSENGLTFGGHSDSHPVLTLERQYAAEEEILANYNLLRQHLGERQIHFAYPNGQHNTALRQVVENVGFASAVTTEPSVNTPGDDLYALRRTCLSEESTRGLFGTYSLPVARLRLGYRRKASPERGPALARRVAHKLVLRFSAALLALLASDLGG